ncbi:hypothetical protein [Pelagibius sp. 7325]|uniref:AbiU2 domain-containing protein n=1 Tax=Pelagibius sp. 7325 TaxID=3131994 RepID=UPI0030EE2D71
MTQEELQRTFIAFREECIWLRNCYNTYAALFESGEDTSRLLHQTAAHFFHDLNRILIEYVILQACKITDPAKFRKRDNLTVATLNIALKRRGLLTEEIREHSKGVMRYRDFLADARNRLISHLDMETVLNMGALGEHSKEDVSSFFDSLQEYCDAVGNVVGVGPLDFRCSPGRGDVIDLVSVLRREDGPDRP